MVDYAKKLKADLVEQFKEQPAIDALAEAIGEQLDALCKFYEDLKERRGVQTAVGKQLDGVGDIVVLSRKEAAEMACFREPVYAIADDLYREYLIYKIWKNTNNCTYHDIIKAFRMFWDKPLYYSERIDEPATMTLETGDLAPEDHAEKLLEAPFVKAAGVRIHVVANTSLGEMQAPIRVICAMGRGYQSTTLPGLDEGVDYNTGFRPVPSSQNIAQTTLPEMEVS